VAEGGLSIGTLSGQITLDDKFTATITLSNAALDELNKRFGSTHAGAIQVAEGMFTAEAAMKAVETAAHLVGEVLKDITVEGARIADVEENFNRLTLASGSLGEELLGTLRKGTHDTINDFELMKSVNDTLAAGIHLTSEQYTTLATGAFALAQAKGLEVKAAFEQINDALLTGKVRGVQYLTGKIDLADAEDKYAAKLGISVDHLNAEEKAQASRIAILDKVSGATQRLGEQQDGLDEKIAQAHTKWDNFTKDLGTVIATSPIILQAFDDIGKIISDAFGGNRDELIKEIAADVEAVTKDAVEFVRVGVEVVQFMNEWKSVLEPLVVGLGAYQASLLLAEAGEKAVLIAGEGLAALETPFALVAVAAASIYAAFELGHWQPVSDFFERLGLRVFYGLSAAEADAAVNATKLGEEQSKAAAAAKVAADAEEEVRLKTLGWQKIVAEINPEIVKHAEASLLAGESLKKVSAEYGISVTQAKALGEEVANNVRIEESNRAKLAAVGDQMERMSREEMKAFIKSWEDLNSLGSTYKDTLDGVNPAIVDTVKYYAELGASVGDLTKAFPGLTQVQAEAAVAGAKAANEISKVWDDVFALQAKMHGDNVNDYIANETRRFNTHIKMLETEGKLTDELLASESARFQATIALEIQGREKQIDTSKAHYQAEADAARAKYDLMLNDTGNFVAADIRKAREDYEEKNRLLQHWAADANDKLSGVRNSSEQTADGIKLIDHEWVTDADIAEQTLNRTTLMVRTLSGEVISLAEAQRRQQSGGSQTYDLSSQIGLDAYKKLNGAATFQLSDESIIDFIKKGGSLQQLIQSGAINPYGGFAGGNGSLPSFEYGGSGDFGAGTVAMLHGKEIILPDAKMQSMFDALNERQAEMWRAAGGHYDDAQRSIIAQMEAMKMPGYFGEPAASPNITNINITSNDANHTAELVEQHMMKLGLNVRKFGSAVR
jgi:hypothetical protein